MWSKLLFSSREVSGRKFNGKGNFGNGQQNIVKTEELAELGVLFYLFLFFYNNVLVFVL